MYACVCTCVHNVGVGVADVSFCFSCVSDDPTTYWKIPAAGAYTWVAFDLGSEYTLTGVRLAGWYVYNVRTCFYILAQ